MYIYVLDTIYLMHSGISAVAVRGVTLKICAKKYTKTSRMGYSLGTLPESRVARDVHAACGMRQVASGKLRAGLQFAVSQR